MLDKLSDWVYTRLLMLMFYPIETLILTSVCAFVFLTWSN
jgi:hypothetical protein